MFLAGMDCDAEDGDVVPGLGDRGGADVDSELTRYRDDYSECRVGGSKSPWVSGGEESELFDDAAFHAPTDPYADFAFGLDDVTYGEVETTSGPLVATGLGYTSALETLRHLESAMEPLTSAGLVPMNLDAALSKQMPGYLSPEPSSFSTLVPPSPSLSPTVAGSATRNLVSMNSDLRSLLDTPIVVAPGTPRISRISGTVSSSGMMFELDKTVSALRNLHPVEEEIAGPRLFQLLDDDGME